MTPGRSPALDWLFGLEQFGIKFGLDNMRALVTALGHPEQSFRSIHVAGTNGKGSVVAMIDASLRAAGHRSARYTSPHLIDLVERFVIEGRPVAPAELERVAGDVRTRVEELLDNAILSAPPTFFEVTTVVAFELFRRHGVDIAVCEVGMGGRLDATNVLSPAVTAITTIGRDHQRYLGTTLAEIAREKAGIIKSGAPVIVGEVDPPAWQAIAEVAALREATVIRAHQDVEVAAATAGPGQIRLRTPRRDYGRLTPALAGGHQIHNVVVAVRVLEQLELQGVPLGEAAIRAGVENVQWPGRLETRRLKDGREVLLDAAHNPDGAAALARALAAGPPRPIVFAAMRDKEVEGMIRSLAPVTSAFIMTRAAHPRSHDPATLAAHAQRICPECDIVIEPSVASALAAAWRLSSRIVIAGSIFLLGDAIAELNRS